MQLVFPEEMAHSRCRDQHFYRRNPAMAISSRYENLTGDPL